MKRFLLSLLLIVGSVSISLAQNPVVTQPYGATSYISPDAIVTTNTFQRIWRASTATTGRVGCIIQNNSATNKMFVYFGAIANATTPNSLQLAAGASLTCTAGVIVLKDEISITGTAGDRYYGAQQ